MTKTTQDSGNIESDVQACLEARPTVAKSKSMARRLQEIMDIPYAQAARLAQGIIIASETQVDWDWDSASMNPVPEEDLALLHFLGSNWTLFLFDMEKPYRTIMGTFQHRDELSAKGSSLDLTVSIQYPEGNLSYLEGKTFSIWIDMDGENKGEEYIISAEGSPHAVADRINMKIRSLREGRSLPTSLIAKWGSTIIE